MRTRSFSALCGAAIALSSCATGTKNVPQASSIGRGSQIELSALVVLAVVLAALAVAYLLLGVRIRSVCPDPNLPKSKSITVALTCRSWTLNAMWYFAALLSLAAFVILTQSMLYYFELRRERSVFSDQLAKTNLNEQYNLTVAVEPKLRFGASDELTIAGLNPVPGEAFIITASLKDYGAKTKSCTPEYLQHMVRSSTVHLHSEDLTVSAPSVDAELLKGGVCTLKWQWVASTPAGAEGPMSALVDLSYRENRKVTLYRTKPLHLAITPVEGPDVLTSVTSFSVALISLCGVLLAAWLKKK